MEEFERADRGPWTLFLELLLTNLILSLDLVGTPATYCSLSYMFSVSVTLSVSLPSLVSVCLSLSRSLLYFWRLDYNLLFP